MSNSSERSWLDLAGIANPGSQWSTKGVIKIMISITIMIVIMIVIMVSITTVITIMIIILIGVLFFLVLFFDFLLLLYIGITISFHRFREWSQSVLI